MLEEKHMTWGGVTRDPKDVRSWIREPRLEEIDLIAGFNYVVGVPEWATDEFCKYVVAAAATASSSLIRRLRSQKTWQGLRRKSSSP